MTTEALSGEITKSGKHYAFGFGWALQYILEEKYGPNIKGLAGIEDNMTAIDDVLLCSLRTREINQIPETFTKLDTYRLLDDLTESDTQQLWKAAKQALGFMERILDLDEASVNALKEAALRNQAEPRQAAPVKSDTNE